MVYFDNAATTMLDNVVKEEIMKSLDEYNMNPSAMYIEGFRSNKYLNNARSILAANLGCRPEEVYFTATGTEANNIALTGSARSRKNLGNEIVTTGYEHPSVYNTLNALRKEGFIVHEIKPSSEGLIDLEELLSYINSRTIAVSVMHVNNEIGSIIDIEKLSEAVKSKNKRTAFHSDMIQSFMKYPIELSKTVIDTAAISAHKIHGPKGIGAIYIRKGFNIEAIIYGGNQEKGVRSGTENTSYAHAFATAADIYLSAEYLSHVSKLQKYLVQQLKTINDVTINSPKEASSYIVNFSLPGYASETLLHFLDSNGVMVSAGAACSKGEKSHTLTAMGLPERKVTSSLRVSFCKDNTLEDVDIFIHALKMAKDKLISTKPRK